MKSDQNVRKSILEGKKSLKAKARTVCRKEEKIDLRPHENNLEPSIILCYQKI